MKPKTEEFLYLLLWTAEGLMRPTVRNLTESFEGWAYRNGLLRQLATLERQHLVERQRQTKSDRLYRLTEHGRLRALGGRDPQVEWSRPWDGRWRLVLFDVPLERGAHRERLRRYLRGKGFGCLQGSVWITPHPVSGECEQLVGGKVQVKSLLLLEARPCGGESDAEIVAGAWNFERINHCYARHLIVLAQRPTGPLHTASASHALQRWGALEREAWLAAVMLDPLLPQCLLPPGYVGRQAWERRVEVLGQAGEQVQTFGR